MSASRAVKGIIGNFLGTYLSRYSDYQGYWVFGFLIDELETMRVDLLNPTPDRRPAFQFAIDLAVTRFKEQLTKGHVDAKSIALAELRLSRGPHPVAVAVNGQPSTGWEIQATVFVELKRVLSRLTIQPLSERVRGLPNERLFEPRQLIPFPTVEISVGPLQLRNGADERSAFVARHVVPRILVQTQFPVVPREHLDRPQ